MINGHVFGEKKSDTETIIVLHQQTLFVESKFPFNIFFILTYIRLTLIPLHVIQEIFFSHRTCVYPKLSIMTSFIANSISTTMCENTCLYSCNINFRLNTNAYTPILESLRNIQLLFSYHHLKTNIF